MYFWWLDVLIDGRIFLNVGIRRRDTGLWLIVVVVRNKVLHRIIGEKRLKLTIKLGSQSFVGRHDKCCSLQALDHIGDRNGLT